MERGETEVSQQESWNMTGGGSGMSTPRVMRPGPESLQASELDPGSAPGLPAPALPRAPRPALPSGPVRSQALLLLTCYTPI